MSESLTLPNTQDRQTLYAALLSQLEALLEGEKDLIANLANTVAALREAFPFLWIGFYLVKGGELVLGPFQGPIACTRIAFHRGVCGHCYTSKETVLVPDVSNFPDHIACSSLTQSEIVVPLFRLDQKGLRTQEVFAVLDIDSVKLNDFSEVDIAGLEALMKVVEKSYSR
jgi:L-methionine (R)-S-oxide reductase